MSGLLATAQRPVTQLSPLHRLPAAGKILALTTYAIVVVATPSGAWWAFAGHALVLAAVVVLSRLPALAVVRRALVGLPVLVFAAILPFVAVGPRAEVAGVSVSSAGLSAAATLVTKATLGVIAAVVLAGTTESRELLVGLERLRLPAPLVAILSFMIRYLSIVSDDLRRMHQARLARGGRGRRGQLAAVAGGVGLLFVRSYERGERVHLAMLSRGYAGRMPALATLATTCAAGATGATGATGESDATGATGGRGLPAAWCAALPAGAAAVLLTFHLMTR